MYQTIRKSLIQVLIISFIVDKAYIHPFNIASYLKKLNKVL